MAPKSLALALSTSVTLDPSTGTKTNVHLDARRAHARPIPSITAST
jgi:hypothetical protein